MYFYVPERDQFQVIEFPCDCFSIYFSLFALDFSMSFSAFFFLQDSMPLLLYRVDVKRASFQDYV